VIIAVYTLSASENLETEKDPLALLSSPNKHADSLLKASGQIAENWIVKSRGHESQHGLLHRDIIVEAKLAERGFGFVELLL